jgi:integrase
MFCERGLREGELLGLSWSQVDFNAGSVRVRVQLQRKRGQGSTKGKKKGRGEHLELVPLKTRSSKRTLRLSRRLTDALKRQRTHQRTLKAQFGADWNPLDLVFPTINGFPMQSSALTHSHFRPVCVLAGIPFSDTARTDGLRIHDLRHTFATRHIKQHRNVMLTKAIMGHSSIAMTERYVHLMAQDENLEAPV